MRLFARLSGFIFLCLIFSADAASQSDLTLYLFRHAETTGEGRNPDLSEKGKQRASDLLNVITENEINELYSTPLNRTMQTIRPFADYFELTVQNYDPLDLEGFAESLLSKTGIILVSGHSNTTPALAQLLTGSEVSPINESEYDNLFIITVVNDIPVLTVINYPPFYKKAQ